MMKQRTLVAYFDAILTKEASKRKDRPGTFGGDLNPWIDLERAAMLNAVNQRRAERGASPVDVTTFMKEVENRAVGHSDY